MEVAEERHQENVCFLSLGSSGLGLMTLAERWSFGVQTTVL